MGIAIGATCVMDFFWVLSVYMGWEDESGDLYDSLRWVQWVVVVTSCISLVIKVDFLCGYGKLVILVLVGKFRLF